MAKASKRVDYWSPRQIWERLELAEGWTLGQVYHGDLQVHERDAELNLPANDGAVFELLRE